MPRSETHPLQPVDVSAAALDRWFDDLTKRSESDTDTDTFFAYLCDRLADRSVDRMVVWLKDPSGCLCVHWPAQYRVCSVPQTQSDDLVGDIEVVRRVIESDQPELLVRHDQSLGVGESLAADPVSRWRDEAALVVPWRALGDRSGAIVCWIAKQPMTDPRSHLPVVAAVAEIVARFQSRQEMLGYQTAIDCQRRMDAFSMSLHACSTLEQTVYTIANDGRPLVDCDRLSVVLRSGNRWTVAAISGAEHVHRHSPASRALVSLCRVVAVTGVPLWQGATGDDQPPQVADALADYLDHSPATSIAVIPLRPPSPQVDTVEPLVGALVVEQYRQDQPSSDQQRDEIFMIAKHAAMAIRRAVSIDRVPGIRFGLWLANHRWADWVSARLLIAVMAMIVAAVCLFMIPADIRVRASGEWMPTIRREVFAPRDAVITAVLVEHGQWVDSGQPLLELRSTELQLEMQQVDSELHQARKRLSVTQSERLQVPPGDADSRNRQRRLAADEEQYQQQVANLEIRQQMLREHQSQLTVLAPIAGQVLTWNAEERLATRPVQRGEALLSVADTNGSWQAELQVPGRHAGRLANAYRSGNDTEKPDDGRTDGVLIASSTAPGIWFHGSIEMLASSLQADSTGDLFLPATVTFAGGRPASQIPLTAGAKVIARIRCGRGSLAKSLFFELVDAVRLWIPF